jgi:deazaflavin-dependent oxidoreductase (nitroreductase family)
MSQPNNFNEQVISEFRANHGKVGGPFEGAPLLLLHTTGARSGQPRVSPVMYRPDGNRYVVFASKAGADTNPGWYHNLMTDPRAQIEVGDQTLDVEATEVRGADREDLYARQASVYPAFAGYQRKTTRVIPVVALTERAAG